MDILSRNHDEDTRRRRWSRLDTVAVALLLALIAIGAYVFVHHPATVMGGS